MPTSSTAADGTAGGLRERHGKDMRSWKEADRTFYELTGPAVREWQPNQGVFEDVPEGIEAWCAR